MAAEIIAIFIPIIFMLVLGIVIITHIYLRSKEKQMMVEKGLTAEQIFQLLESKKEEGKKSTWLLVVGIILIFFGFGLGLGLLIEEYSGIEEWKPLLLFVFTGVGAVVAFFMDRKIREKEEQKKLQ